MRYIAASAVLFGAAALWAPGSHASLTEASQLNTIIKPASYSANLAPAPSKAQLASAGKAPEAPKPHTVVVAEGDSLSKLAEAGGTTYRRLYDANPNVDNPDMIYPGQELRIPAADEQLPERPLPAAASVPAPADTRAVTLSNPAPVSLPAPAPVRRAPAPPAAGGSVWDSLAACESGGNWAINTGNGFYGGLQFTLATWQGLGGSGLPSSASRDEQIMRAEMLLARSGWGNWPACSAKLGLR